MQKTLKNIFIIIYVFLIFSSIAFLIYKKLYGITYSLNLFIFDNFIREIYYLIPIIGFFTSWFTKNFKETKVLFIVSLVTLIILLNIIPYLHISKAP